METAVGPTRDKQQPHYQVADYSDAESALHHDGQSMKTESIVGTDDNISLNSRTHFLSHQRQHSASSSTSTLQADKLNNPQRRSTVSYVSGLQAARNPGGPKPKNSTSRTVFRAACAVVEAVAPLDVNKEKTSMKESSVYRVLKRQRHENNAGVSEEIGSESNRARAASLPY